MTGLTVNLIDIIALNNKSIFKLFENASSFLFTHSGLSQIVIDLSAPACVEVLFSLSALVPFLPASSMRVLPQ
jgi:hypothetical protein